MHADKLSAEASGRKFPDSEKHFYDVALERITIILAAGMQMSSEESGKLLLDALDEAIQAEKQTLP